MDGVDSLSHEELIGLVQSLSALNRELSQQVQALQQEVAQLREQLGGPRTPVVPSFIKPNRPVKRAQQKPDRKKRAQAFVRAHQPPTQVQVHVQEHCPDCGRPLSGGWGHRRRQVIEVAPAPVQIIEHVVMARWCGVCAKRCVPRLDLSTAVVGRHRVGVRLMSLVAWLHTVGRLPLRTIQSLLGLLYRLHLGQGELSEILHTVAAQGAVPYARLQEQVRGSPFVHADETGWRQEGQNGYLWSFSTPQVRYFVYNKSRSGDVAVQALGAEFAGIAVSDFYGGYNKLLGLHQRCWVHFLRDLHALQEAHPQEAAVGAWVAAVRQVYERGKSLCQEAAFVGASPAVRARARVRLEEELLSLARPHLKQPVPQRVLCERIERFLPELFMFVEHPQVPSENNAAERSVRPAVIARKISGGTRSEKGSATKATLLSLFGTWQAQGVDALEACRQMLLHPAPVPAD